MIEKLIIRDSVGDLQVHPIVNVDLAWKSVERVTGLGSPQPRPEVFDLARRHGQVDRTAFYTGRVVDISGRIISSAIGTDSDLHVALDAIKQKLALANDIKLVFRRRGRTTDEFVAGRVSSAVEVEYTPRVVHAIYWGAQVLAPDPRMYTDILNTASYDPTIVSSPAGIKMPIKFPLVFGVSTSGLADVLNGGNFKSPPTLTINGPVVNPTVQNVTTGEQMVFSISLAAGDTMIVDVQARTVTIAGGLRADVVNVSSTTWWELAPGHNFIRMIGTGMVTAQTSFTVAWRDARI